MRTRTLVCINKVQWVLKFIWIANNFLQVFPILNIFIYLYVEIEKKEVEKRRNWKKETHRLYRSTRGRCFLRQPRARRGSVGTPVQLELKLSVDNLVQSFSSPFFLLFWKESWCFVEELFGLKGIKGKWLRREVPREGKKSKRKQTEIGEGTADSAENFSVFESALRVAFAAVHLIDMCRKNRRRMVAQMLLNLILCWDGGSPQTFSI